MSSPLDTVSSSAPPQPYRILVAVAFDATGDCALREGVSLATQRRGSELHVVHAVADISLREAAETPTAPEERLTQAPAALRARIEALWQQEGAIEVIGHFRWGQAADTILEVAAEIDADLLVLGTHQRSGLQKILLGSVGAHVLPRAHCPVLFAMPKDSVARSERIEPPCPDCVQARAQSAKARMWCERHSRHYMAPHVYVPSDRPRESVMTTY